MPTPERYASVLAAWRGIQQQVVLFGELLAPLDIVPRRYRLQVRGQEQALQFAPG